MPFHRVSFPISENLDIVAFILVISLCATLYTFRVFSLRKVLPLPPGPRPLPFIGNLHQAPIKDPWRAYQQWHKKYGPIFSLKYGQNNVIVLGSHKSAHDLLDKRGSIYSSRPRLVVAGECVTKGHHTGLLPYGTQWRAHHHIQASFLNFNASQHYRQLQDLESKQLVYEMLSSDKFSESFHRYSSSLIFTLAYGKRMIRGDEHEIQEVDEVAKNILQALHQGRTLLVEAFPFLNSLPRWLARWKIMGDEFHAREAGLHICNMLLAQKSMSWNWTKEASKIREAREMKPKELAYVIGMIYEAGADTTATVLEVFVMACVLHPAAVRKAQLELDDVIGNHRLPNFQDRDSLGYINAFILETLRWRPLTPGGIPHAVVEDDEYMGYRIPKGATVIANHWSLDFDEELYERPEDFAPDRWIEHPDLPLSAFGFGRRVCPGQHVARNSLFIIMSRLLWAYNFAHAFEKGEQCIIDPLNMQQSTVSGPVPFKAALRVRSPRHREVIENAWLNSEKETKKILERLENSKT